MARLRYNNQFGALATSGTDVTNSTSATLINFAVAPNFATIVAPDYIPLPLDAGKAGMEIVWLTAYTAGATSGTVTRAAEDATNWPAATHAAGTWACDLTVLDLATAIPESQVTNLTTDLATKVAILTPTLVKTANYTLLVADNTVLCNAVTAGFTITLPTAVGVTGKQYTIKKTDTSLNVVTVATTSSQTIDGNTTNTIATPYASITVISDGANWNLI